MTESERLQGATPFPVFYDMFFSLVTEDMYLEWSKEETIIDIKNILLAAIPGFRFPRFKLFAYEKEIDPLTSYYTVGDKYPFLLDQEEVKIIGDLMVLEWIRRQIATVDVTRQKYSSKDFELTSQANHLAKLLQFEEKHKENIKEAQMLYKRRVIGADGYVKPNYSGFGGKANAN